MKRKSTQFTAEVVEEPMIDDCKAAKSSAGSPRQSTLELIRRFARCYHFETAGDIPMGMILN